MCETRGRRAAARQQTEPSRAPDAGGFPGYKRPADTIKENYPKLCPDGEVPEYPIEKTKKRVPKKADSFAPRAYQFGFWYSYAFGSENVSGKNIDYASTALEPQRPFVGDSGHSLGQLWLIDDGGAGPSTVEFGWRVSPAAYGDSNPHFFVYHFDDGQVTGYGAGFVQYSSRIANGTPLATGAGYRGYIAQLFNGNWWIQADNEWIGYFPRSAWVRRWPVMDRLDMAGEVASPQHDTCTDMGNGRVGTDPAAPSFAYSWWHSPSYGSQFASLWAVHPDWPRYTVGQPYNDATGQAGVQPFSGFRYGGWGYC